MYKYCLDKPQAFPPALEFKMPLMSICKFRLPLCELANEDWQNVSTFYAEAQGMLCIARPVQMIQTGHHGRSETSSLEALLKKISRV